MSASDENVSFFPLSTSSSSFFIVPSHRALGSDTVPVEPKKKQRTANQRTKVQSRVPRWHSPDIFLKIS